MTNAKAAQQRLRSLGCPQQAAILARFFKTGPGQYGEGDRFHGVRVPQVRRVAREFRDLPLADVAALLRSGWHEERLCALLLLVRRFERVWYGMERGSPEETEECRRAARQVLERGPREPPRSAGAPG